MFPSSAGKNNNEGSILKLLNLDKAATPPDTMIQAWEALIRNYPSLAEYQEPPHLIIELFDSPPEVWASIMAESQNKFAAIESMDMMELINFSDLLTAAQDYWAKGHKTVQLPARIKFLAQNPKLKDQHSTITLREFWRMENAYNRMYRPPFKPEASAAEKRLALYESTARGATENNAVYQNRLQEFDNYYGGTIYLYLLNIAAEQEDVDILATEMIDILAYISDSTQVHEFSEFAKIQDLISQNLQKLVQSQKLQDSNLLSLLYRNIVMASEKLEVDLVDQLISLDNPQGAGWAELQKLTNGYDLAKSSFPETIILEKSRANLLSACSHLLNHQTATEIPVTTLDTFSKLNLSSAEIVNLANQLSENKRVLLVQTLLFSNHQEQLLAAIPIAANLSDPYQHSPEMSTCYVTILNLTLRAASPLSYENAVQEVSIDTTMSVNFLLGFSSALSEKLTREPAAEVPEFTQSLIQEIATTDYSVLNRFGWSKLYANTLSLVNRLPLQSTTAVLANLESQYGESRKDVFVMNLLKQMQLFGHTQHKPQLSSRVYFLLSQQIKGKVKQWDQIIAEIGQQNFHDLQPDFASQTA